MPEITSNYIEVHVCNINSGHKYLMLKRSEKSKIYPGIWQMVTGKIDEGESTTDAVIRELHEETGLKAEKIFVVPKINSFYFPTNDKIVLSPVFLAIVNETNVKISDEHCEYKWVSYDEAAKLIYWPNQVESLSIIKQYFADEALYNKLIEIKL